jgi:hypothetical protein
MRRRCFRVLSTVMAIIAAGTVFELSGCSLSGLANYAGNFNPCGSILNCDPVAYRFFTSGYDGPGADPSVDPSCTYPPFCGDAQNPDPFAPVVSGQQQA